MPQMTDAEYDAYMAGVLKARAAWEKKTAEQQQILKTRLKEMEKEFLGGKTREKVESEMPKGSRGKFGLVGTGKFPQHKRKK